MSEEVKETAGGELTQGEFKIKKSPKKLVNQDPVAKVDLSKPKKVIEETITKVDLTKEEIKEPVEEKETPIIQEIKEEEIKEEVKEITKELKEAVRDEKVVGRQLPENVEKLVSFMEETGGNVEDYVRLNTDYSKIDDNSLLREYYKNTKPHLDHEEISFIMEDSFKIDEDLDEERDVKKKKLAFKEEIAKAKNFLEETKSKYYDEIKLRPGVTQEQQKAMDFFNRYNENKKVAADKHEQFVNTTKEYFTKDFKGFEFNLGDTKFSYNINNTEEVIDQQSDLEKFVGKFLNEEGRIDDHKGYHKALYAARNADTIAKHFYEQGKSDGIKNIVNKSKNIDTASRPQNNEDLFINGFKVKAISGIDSSKLKIKTKNNKN
tara:strand:+ start:4005 stop:5135 length:1131 start_codon:yes stop_codon:yes gene_type:complete